MTSITYDKISPRIDESVFIADNARIIGNVTIGKNSSVWFGAVIRGDVNTIEIGSGSNIQDLSVLHVTKNQSTIHIGDYVTVGHAVILHGCTIRDHVLVGMGSIVMDGAVIGANTIIGAGSLVTQNMKIESGVLVLGRPAKVVRKLSAEEIGHIKQSADHYIETAKQYRVLDKT